MSVPSGTASSHKKLVVVEHNVGIKSLDDANSIDTLRVELLIFLLLLRYLLQLFSICCPTGNPLLVDE